MNIEKTIRDYLPSVIHLSLATCAGRQPWVCEVHFAYDEDLNLYFMSKPDCRHSREIALNPNVAGNIVTQHAADEKPRGVYFEGIAQELADIHAAHPAYIHFSGRFHAGPGLLEDVKRENGHRFYQIQVKTFFLFDGRESSPGQKYELNWGQRSHSR